MTNNIIRLKDLLIRAALIVTISERLDLVVGEPA